MVDSNHSFQTTIFHTVPYPKTFFDDIKKGKKIDFHELCKTGLVVSYLIFDKNYAEYMLNDLKTRAKSQPQLWIMDIEKIQKKLDRFCDIMQKTGKIDHDEFNKIFESVCYSSIFLSEYKNPDKPILISHDMLEINWGSKLSANYIAVATHPDLLTGNKINLYADITIEKFKEKLGSKQTKKTPRKSWTESQKEKIRNKQNGKCNKCQKHPPRWEYHHKDENRNNNSTENCEGLCPSCHSVITYDDN